MRATLPWQPSHRPPLHLLLARHPFFAALPGRGPAVGSADRPGRGGAPGPAGRGARWGEPEEVFECLGGAAGAGEVEGADRDEEKEAGGVTEWAGGSPGHGRGRGGPGPLAFALGVGGAWLRGAWGSRALRSWRDAAESALLWEGRCLPFCAKELYISII